MTTGGARAGTPVGRFILAGRCNGRAGTFGNRRLASLALVLAAAFAMAVALATGLIATAKVGVTERATRGCGGLGAAGIGKRVQPIKYRQYFSACG